MDDVIYLRAPCRASYGKSNKDIIYNLAYPRLSSSEMAYVCLLYTSDAADE